MRCFAVQDLIAVGPLRRREDTKTLAYTLRRGLIGQRVTLPFVSVCLVVKAM
jgi:hypothetical protein